MTNEPKTLAAQTRKAAVLTHLKTAWEQICAAEEILAGSTELRNQIYNEFDSPLDDLMEDIQAGEFNESLEKRLQ